VKRGPALPRLAGPPSFLAALHLCCGTTVCAQASIPDRGEGSVTLTYENYVVSGHFDVQGHENTNGGTRSHAVVAEIDYGVIDQVGLIVSLPFISSKYTGPPSYFVGPYETFPGPLDDGKYHAAVQDVRIEVRRRWWAGSVPFAPFVGVSFPTHDYETVGEAVPGRRRRDVQIGANAGVDLDRVLSGAYVQGRYAYGAMQRVNNLPFTRSNIDVEAGIPAASRLVVTRPGRLAGQAQRTIARGAGPRLGEPRSIHRTQLPQSRRGGVRVVDRIDGRVCAVARHRCRKQWRSSPAHARDRRELRRSLAPERPRRIA